MIFDDDLIKQGETGGKEAANSLSSSVRGYIHKNVPDLSSDYKIVTRIYANLKGLGDVCHKAGISTKPSTMEEFARGFTGSKHLFDFVDVGMGKDRADEKISGEWVVAQLSHGLVLPPMHCHRYTQYDDTLTRVRDKAYENGMKTVWK